MKVGKLFSYTADILVSALFVFLLIFPDKASLPVRQALAFCAQTLIPSLFIYMVLARMLASSPLTDRLTAFFGCEPVLLLLGTLCGAPVGATLAESLYSSGRIEKKHAEYLCAFTNNVSASFLLGFVGQGMFGDIRAGLRLLAYQLFASVTTAVVLKFVMFGKKRLPRPASVKGARVGLREAITGGAVSMLNVCACAVFFIVVSGAVSSLLGVGGEGGALIQSILEFSSGCAAAAGMPTRTMLIICAFACGQTGFSVALQVRSVTAGKLSIKPYLAGKIINCAVMTLLAFFAG